MSSVVLKPLAVTRERETLNQIISAFKHLQLVQQYKVSSFRIDLYFPDYKIAVECDENGHKHYQRDAEATRQAYIEQALGCKFVRYNPDALDFNIGDVIHRIMMFVYNEKELVISSKLDYEHINM